MHFTAHREIDRFFSVSDGRHHLMDASTGSVTLIAVSFEHRLMETLVSQFVRIREFMDQSVYLNKLYFTIFRRGSARMRFPPSFIILVFSLSTRMFLKQCDVITSLLLVFSLLIIGTHRDTSTGRVSFNAEKLLTCGPTRRWYPAGDTHPRVI